MPEENAQRIRCGLARVFLATFLVLVARMAFVQLIIGEDLAERCRDQRAVLLAEVPGRAPIYDRNMRVLAGEFASQAIVVFPESVEARETVARMVAHFTGRSWRDVLPRLDSPTPIYVAAGAVPSIAWHAGGIDSATLDEALRDPGVVVVERPVRYHPDGIGAHVLGYLDPSGMRGVSGVESLLDRYLSGGTPGGIAVFTDARGRPLRGLGVRRLPGKPVGGGVRLTIDRDIQALVEDVMDDTIERGAVVVMDPRTGDVLAMASRPAFRPDNIASAMRDQASPLLNRAIRAYPPGSIFKVVVAAAAIESGAASLHETFYDPGYVDVGAARFRCYAHDEGGHGELDLLDAMAYSCNTAFITTGLRTGAKRLLDLAERLGLGATTGVALPGEQAGVIPDAQSMSPQDVANLAIGQGRLSVTPLQVAAMISTVANGGFFRRPRLVMEIAPGSRRDGLAAGRDVEPAEPVRVLSEDTCRQVALMLEAVTRWGTGTAAWVAEGGSAGKTGSAETAKADGTGSPPSHAWFAGFAPLSEPRLVIVVLVEEGMSGGRAAAPVFARIARRALEVYPSSG
ncbi:MAG: peptidoglycan D,D-transpeptidase FtsI family protein [Clostridia bacterium]